MNNADLIVRMLRDAGVRYGFGIPSGNGNVVKNQGNIHSAVFQSEKALQLLRGILIGRDRKVLLSKFF